MLIKAPAVQARDLAAKDRNGTSDPYIIVTVGDSRVTTHSVSKNLNPEWNVVQDLPVNSVQCLLLNVICWDKDRFGKDYMGEFDLLVDEIFQNEQPEQPPKWYRLRSKRPGKKTGVVSGEVLLQFSLVDSNNPNATPQQLVEKLNALVRSLPTGSSRNVTPSRTPTLEPTTMTTLTARHLTMSRV
jgi:phosphatidylserine decarboxylase